MRYTGGHRTSPKTVDALRKYNFGRTEILAFIPPVDPGIPNSPMKFKQTAQTAQTDDPNLKSQRS